MKDTVVSVKTKDADETWNLNVKMPESFDEAVSMYGEEAAFGIFESGLRVKIQNVGREILRKGKSIEEAEKAANEYKPGIGKTSLKVEAMNKVVEYAEDMREDVELHNKVMSAFKSNKFAEVIALLDGEVEE